MSAEIGRGSRRLQPPEVTTARTPSSSGSMAMQKQLSGRCFGKSRNRRKFTCFDQTYLKPPYSIFLPLFSQVAMVVKQHGASRGWGHRSTSTGGRVGRHETPHNGSGQSSDPRFSPEGKK